MIMSVFMMFKWGLCKCSWGETDDYANVQEVKLMIV